jgi:hypothetical protein
VSFDPGDVDLIVSKIGAQAIDQMTGIDFDVQQNVSFNEGPGGRVYGFNTQKRANGVSISFSVRQTSPHMRKLMELVRDQKETVLDLNVVRNLDEYAEDEPIGFSCPRAILQMQGIGFGRGEASDVGFTALCIGYTFKFRDPAGTQPKTMSNN